MSSVPAEDLLDIAARLEKIWPCNKTFLITGGTGFFGRWIVEAVSYLEEKLKSRNIYYVTSRQKDSLLFEKIRCLGKPYFRLLQVDLAEGFHSSAEFDFVIHAAGEVASAKNSAGTDFSYLVKSTENILNFLKKKPPQQFLYVSSGGVYRGSESALAESAAVVETDSISSYAAGKRASEKLVEASGLRYCIVRCFSFVGPFAEPRMAVMEMLERKKTGEAIAVRTPQAVRSFMYPTDLVVALFRLLFRLQTESQIYNLGSDQPISLGDLAIQVSELEGDGGSVVRTPESTSNALAGLCYYPDLSKIKTELSGVLTVDLKAALIKTFNFLKREPST